MSAATSRGDPVNCTGYKKKQSDQCCSVTFHPAFLVLALRFLAHTSSDGASPPCSSFQSLRALLTSPSLGTHRLVPLQLLPAPSAPSILLLPTYWLYLLCSQTPTGQRESDEAFMGIRGSTRCFTIHFPSFLLLTIFPNDECLLLTLPFISSLTFSCLLSLHCCMETIHKPPSVPCPALRGKFKSLFIFSTHFTGKMTTSNNHVCSQAVQIFHLLNTDFSTLFHGSL